MKDKWKLQNIYTMVGIIQFCLGSLLIIVSKIPNNHPSLSQLAFAAGLVIVTSLLYRVIYDLFVKPSEHENIAKLLRTTLAEHNIGNRVNVLFENKEIINAFEKRLDSSRSSLICCGTSLIKIRNHTDAMISKLEYNKGFIIDIYLFSPSNRLDLIQDYINSTQEMEFINHLRITYTTFLQLSAQFTEQVNLYLYHTLPFFSCVVFDHGKDKESMIVRQYVNGKYPPDCPVIELDSNREIDKRMIKEHMTGIEFLKKKSIKLQIDSTISKYWDERSEAFENLSWVVDQELIDKIISISGVKKENEVLEIGSGTGALAEKIGNRVGSFIGVDISKEMVRIANEKQIPNTFFMYSDARDLRYFSEYRFDTVFARMVLHHITHDLPKCLTEMDRVLKRGGRLIICENMPLTDDVAVANFHRHCLQVKEERITFSPDTLKRFIRVGGFKIDDEKGREFIASISLDNWLTNNNLDEQRKQKIKELFNSMPDDVRTKLNCIPAGDDLLFDTKFLILCAIK